MILNGWKQIASYVRSSVRTVQRWEKAGMPVVRPLPGSRGSVMAHAEHLDSWFGRPSGVEAVSAPPQALSITTRQDLHRNLLHARQLTDQNSGNETGTARSHEPARSRSFAPEGESGPDEFREEPIRRLALPLTAATELSWLEWNGQGPRSAA